MKTKELHKENKHILYDAYFDGLVQDNWFEPSYWQQQSTLVNTSRGRGATWVVQYEEHQWVLRHYFRGGWIANLLHDQYLWTGLERTRAWREWHLLAEMYEMGLPVPKPVATRVVRAGGWYRADLISRRILHTIPLSDHLEQQALSVSQWREVGDTIKRFHREGIYHADLNANNILIETDGPLYLIDFDKGERRTPGDWQAANLDRLHRSLIKLKRLSPRFHFHQGDWQHVLDGYNQT